MSYYQKENISRIVHLQFVLSPVPLRISHVTGSLGRCGFDIQQLPGLHRVGVESDPRGLGVVPGIWSHSTHRASPQQVRGPPGDGMAMGNQVLEDITACHSAELRSVRGWPFMDFFFVVQS